MNKKSMFGKFLLACLFVVGVVSCSDGDEEVIIPDSLGKGVFILNEGSFGMNNASLSFVEKSDGSEYFDLMDGTLGETAQDMLIYGSRLYIAVYGSQYISVVDAYSKKELKKISFENSGPRYLTVHGGNVYASIYNGYVACIDTLDLGVKAMVEVGSNPEGIAVLNNKLYVAITNAMDYSNVDNKVAVVDLSSFTKTGTIEVNMNPYYLQADASGYLYVSSQDVWSADFSTIVSSGKLQRIDTNDGNRVEDVRESMVLKYVLAGNDCYYFDYSGVGVLNLTTKESKEFITDGTQIGTPYGIGLDPVSKELYLSGTDYQNPGKVYVFGQDGKKKQAYSVGINPNGFAFYY